MLKRIQLTLLCLAVMFVIPVILWMVSTNSVQSTARKGANWQSYYWNNTDFSGDSVYRFDTAIDFDWAESSPIPDKINTDKFSVRWYNTIYCTDSGVIRLRGGANDGIRMVIDNEKVLDQFTGVNDFTPFTADVYLTKGEHKIVVDYFENEGQTRVLLNWISLGDGDCDTDWTKLVNATPTWLLKDILMLVVAGTIFIVLLTSPVLFLTRLGVPQPLAFFTVLVLVILLIIEGRLVLLLGI